MTIAYEEDNAMFSAVVSVEEAEGLLEWLQGKSAARVDFSECTHLHPANLQVLMVAQPAISAWPADAAFALWLQSALSAP